MLCEMLRVPPELAEFGRHLCGITYAVLRLSGSIWRILLPLALIPCADQ